MDAGLRYRVKRVARQIASQHGHIHATFEAIRRVAALGAGQELRTALTHLQDAVDAHFSLEEDVFFPAIRGLDPASAEALRMLSREHGRFATEIRRIAAGLDLPDLLWFTRAFEEFASAMAAHEDREEELVGALTDALRSAG